MIMMAGYNGFDDSTTMVIEQRFDKALLIDELRYERCICRCPRLAGGYCPAGFDLAARYRHCYDQITSYCLSLASHAADRYLDRLHPEHKCVRVSLPLNAKGDIYENKGFGSSSGRDLVLKGNRMAGRVATVAERKCWRDCKGGKWVFAAAAGRGDRTRTRASLRSFRGKMLIDAEVSLAWLLYTTYSPLQILR